MGTIADKLIYLGQTKTEIRNAMAAKGVTIPEEAPFRDYAGKILEIKTETGENPLQWRRPADWLRIEDKVVAGNQKFVGLHAIFEDSNFISLSATGNYTVDWGDGVTENYASGVQAYHSYSYSSFPGTESTRGYRQAIVTVTPQTGQNLTNINLQRKHKQAGLNVYSSGWLDIRVSGTSMSSMNIGGSVLTNAYLEAFNYLGGSSIASYNRFFYGCSQLQSVAFSDTAKGSDFSSMFESCTFLKTVPLFDTANGTNFSGMFYGCASLQSVPTFDTAKGLDFSIMFSFCTSLQNVPALNTINGTVFISMFESCVSLRTIPLLNTSKGTDFSYMFQGCPSLQTVPLFDTGKGTDFSNMFSGCTGLQTIPLFKTSAGTTFSNTFTNCASLNRAALSGAKNTISYAGCKLSKAALVEVFSNLASGVTSKTVTITNNWGAPLLTASDKAIATGKGWTIVG